MTHFSLDDSFGYLINNLALLLKRELHQVFKSHGHQVTPEQWAILNRLWEQDGLTQVELAERTFKDKPNVTRMLDVLERRELVYRQPDENDRRAYKIHLTEQGRALQDQLVPLAEAVLERGQKNLTNEDIARLNQTLKVIYGNFT
ncbi:MAG: MarR family transcriptional regulator [Anaerolineae bacterium]|nr:MarR family transcriptional regulator [Anaerolineae bacterium]